MERIQQSPNCPPAPASRGSSSLTRLGFLPMNTAQFCFFLFCFALETEFLYVAQEPRAVGNSSNRIGKSWAPHLQTELKLTLRKAVCMCGCCAQGTEIMGPQLCGLTLGDGHELNFISIKTDLIRAGHPVSRIRNKYACLF